MRMPRTSSPFPSTQFPSDHPWSDHHWMERALQLAALGEGRTSPNPMVGAVVLDRDGLLVGEGFHARAGEAHAEVMALAQAGERARGGTLYVTLEPCCHHGRTPPCTEAILRAGLARVVVAMADPNPLVDGGGIARLRLSGVPVDCGVAEGAARALNRAFLHRLHTGRPYAILKWAMSLDGRTALPNGSSQWISGPEARQWVHRLRAGCDAVIVGGGTVRADDPLLTSRGLRQLGETGLQETGPQEPGPQEPLRVVLSRSLDLPAGARLWDQGTAPTLVAHGYDAPGRRRFQLDRLGVERLLLQPCDPLRLLEALAQRGCNRVLWECGPELAAAALRQGCVQEVAAVVAPRLLGGEPARTPLGLLGLEDVQQARPWQPLGLSRAGGDLIWRLGPSPSFAG